MELNKPQWEKEAERLSELQEGTYTKQHKVTYKHGFTDGSQSMLTAVEKMLLQDNESFSKRINEAGIWHEERMHLRKLIEFNKSILFKLKSIQP